MCTIKGKTNTLLKTGSTICVRDLIDYIITGPITTDQSVLPNRPDIFMLDGNTKEAYLLHVAISNSHTLYSIIMEKFQKCTDLAQQITRT
jgi:hypothetical protein